jgi:hypothetical protein
VVARTVPPVAAQPAVAAVEAAAVGAEDGNRRRFYENN